MFCQRFCLSVRCGWLSIQGCVTEWGRKSGLCGLDASWDIMSPQGSPLGKKEIRHPGTCLAGVFSCWALETAWSKWHSLLLKKDLSLICMCLQPQVPFLRSHPFCFCFLFFLHVYVCIVWVYMFITCVLMWRYWVSSSVAFLSIFWGKSSHGLQSSLTSLSLRSPFWVLGLQLGRHATASLFYL